MPRRLLVFLILTVLVPAAVHAQDKLPAPKVVPPEPRPTPPPADAVAASVNGEKIPEVTVFRALLRENPKHRDAARKDVVTYLVDNLLVDQYLRQLKVSVEDKEVDERVTQIKTELEKVGQKFEKQMEELFLTEAELRKEITSALRWDKFVLQQGTDKVLRDLFDGSKMMFDGTQVRARHILLSTKEIEPEKAKAKLEAIKKHIEGEVAAQLAKLPAGSDKLAVEKERSAALEKVFADLAARESTCPSKSEGGDLGLFPRVGAMVEPFARTAFSLRAHQMSDPVQTEFGCHLILTTEWKAGKEVKFEDVKGFVMEVYGERLREAVLNAYRPRSKVELHKGG